MRRVVLGGETTTLGSGEDADLRCVGPGIASRQLRFVKTARGVRVEAVRAGGTVVVNGDDLFSKDLDAGDVIELGAVQVRWLGARRPAPAAPRATARAARGAGGSVRRPRSRGAPTWLMVSGALLLCVAIAALGLKALAGSTWPHGPQDYVDLAREQLGNHEPQRALDTLEFALRDARGAVRDEALGLQADIRRMLVERNEQPLAQAAREQHDPLAAFEARYLQGAVERPAAREFVRQADAWLARHGELCRRHSDGKPLLRYVESARARYAPAAALGEPESAQDVSFAVAAHLRFQWREYPAALARLDAHLARTPDAALRAERERLLEEGEQWLQQKLRQIDQLLDRGDRSNAARELQSLERYSMRPQWEPAIAERKARL